MYKTTLVAVDGSYWSDCAVDAAMSIARLGSGSRIIGCHVYAARMHRIRFEDMEPGLPDKYQDEERLQSLRGSHDNLISHGMRLISEAYLGPPAARAREMGIAYQPMILEGRNYVELAKAAREHQADLVVLGGWGHGRIPESQLGSVAERLLLQLQDRDVLVVKGPWQPEGKPIVGGKPIVVGLDGSSDSYSALRRALSISQLTGARVEGVAVYDPFFHSGVFRATADILPPEVAQRFDFSTQEKLHDEIIDLGLEQVYRDGLERGMEVAKEAGIEMKGEVLAGKVYVKLHQYAVAREAALLVVGRWGLHKEATSLIGSNAMALARLSQATNILIIAPEGRKEAGMGPKSGRLEAEEGLAWTPEAEEYLQRVPFFARGMARRAIERRAREEGLWQITLETVQQAARRFGMGY